MADRHETVVQRMIELYHMLVCHDGFGEMSIDIRILKRGQKEVIIRCGKQYRFVVDAPGDGALPEEWLMNWKHDGDLACCQTGDTALARGVAVARRGRTRGGDGRD